ncbi:RNase P modulator RnpM [Lentibacillus saliphilus]|uniref:RNase P modulator RnpM n=1 Tax=Lentibacillus saliphilus TaxID=2737028 RepID=UPI001C2F88FC|nr:YlxR family protein [Lentibacillus saliphilus]
MVKKKKTPLRKCIATNEMKPKKDLIRIVRNKDGDIFVDETGKQNGRGAYVSRDVSAIEQARKSGALNRQFKTDVDQALYDKLIVVARGSDHDV